MTRSLEVHVEASHCIRCGACATVCPGVFDVSGPQSRVARQPLPSELTFISAARLICPTDAIRATSTGDGEAAPFTPLDAALFPTLATGAEAVRWRYDAIPWKDLDASRAHPELRGVVREMAFAENATYSATQRFLESFFDDVDFTQWISVWFYEETRHPHVLIDWLRRVGEPISPDFVLRGRVSTPFMKSFIGTLVTNIISEVTAAHAYRRLAHTSPEPVLRTIAQLISGDEARHAGSFVRFAAKALAGMPAEAALRERARGLEVLQAWLGGAQQATHPVAQMVDRLNENETQQVIDLGFAAIRTRVLHTIGHLFDLPLYREADVPLVLRDLLTSARS